MMGYTEDPTMVRVDFFKESGEWYVTEAVRWTGGWSVNKRNVHDAFDQSLRDHLGDRLGNMDAVCLHPYHEYAFPLCHRAGSWLK